jgi:hypothetical protein
MKNKYIRLIVIAYIAINILGVIVYFAMPKASFVQAKAGVDLNQINTIREEVQSNPQILVDMSLEDKYNIKSFSFNYEGKALEVPFVKQYHQIFIDRKTSDDSKVEVYWYSGPITVNGIDFTSVLKEPNIKLESNRLSIEYEKQRYSFTLFSKDPVSSQFYEKKDNASNNRVSGFGHGIIYIKIPKNLKILGDDISYDAELYYGNTEKNNIDKI